MGIPWLLTVFVETCGPFCGHNNGVNDRLVKKKGVKKLPNPIKAFTFLPIYFHSTDDSSSSLKVGGKEKIDLD